MVDAQHKFQAEPCNLRRNLAYVIIMVLTSPVFRVEILPNALNALPDLFEGLDSILPALDIQLEETLSSLKAQPTEVLVTANLEQAILDSRPVFLVHPNPNSRKLADLLDSGRPVRWVPQGTPHGTWVDGFAHFIHTLRMTQKADKGGKTRPDRVILPKQPASRRKAS